MIHFKSKSELQKMRDAGRILAQTFDYLSSYVKVGVSAAYLDNLIYEFILSKGAKPSFLGFNGYKYSSCISKNDEIVHGIPADDKFFYPGDICSIDIGVFYRGFHADAARIFSFEPLDEKIKHLVRVTEESFYKAVDAGNPGEKIGNMLSALQSHVEDAGLTIVTELYSHGIGKNLHEDPLIPNYGKAGTGLVLKPGFTFALEPMVNIGNKEFFISEDNWTIITSDRYCSAHYENTVAVTDNGLEILTILT